MPDDYMVRYRDKRIKTEFGHGRHGPARDAGPYGMIGGDGINDESNKTRQPYCGRQLAETQNGHSPDSAAEGFLGRMKTESVYPEHWEECACDEVLVLIDDYIHWYNHARIKRSFGWMSPVECRQKTKEGLRDCLQENVRSTFSMPNVAASSTTRGSANRSACSASNAPSRARAIPVATRWSNPRVFRQVAAPPSLNPHLNRLPQLHHGMCQAPTLPLHFRTFYERVRMTAENSTSANMVDSRSFPLHGEMRVNFCPRCRLLSLRAVLRCRHKACLL